jgi:molybdopterin molybdotransferase
VRLRGEDVRAKALLLEPGELLTAQRLSLLSAAGMAAAPAGQAPRVGLVTTGDELCEPGRPLPPGMIYESNRCGLSALLRNINIDPRCARVPDNLDMTKRALSAALKACDVVITVGGASVGDMDWVKQAFEGLDVTLDFWRVAIRPGKPFVFGQKGRKLVFGLPGNPVSAFVTFFLLVRPALLRMQGAGNVQPPASWGTLAEPLSNHGDRRHFMRVILDAEGRIRSAGSQASHMSSSMARANGLVEVPPATTWPAGTPAAVLRWS